MASLNRLSFLIGSIASFTSAYTLVDTYDHTNWMNKFSVQSIQDPTGGFVHYLDQADAESQGLYQIQGNQVYIGVDYTSHLDPNGQGRNSVRLQSNPSYNHGLIIGDFAHIPSSACGSWPAYWMVGSNWPNNGEIDIIEGVNDNAQNQMTLHTAPGCTVNVGPGGQTGTSIGDPNCGDGGGYNGCPVVDYVGTSYGTGFDARGGGVYATQWTSSFIKIWYFPYDQVPSDISSGNPNPDSWGTPAANFGGCAFDNYIRNLQIIFDNTFCGGWAGSVWSQSQCSKQNPSCINFVASEPQVYQTAYWLVNSVKVYQ